VTPPTEAAPFRFTTTRRYRVIQPNPILVDVLLLQLRAAGAAIARLDDEIAKLAPSLPDPPRGEEARPLR